mmetsp:Transcript_14416/g.21644  ORF Transcript_14416/g.21644 Transcript_14416/m.21644 type:complete len:1114 (+) Transcript_14416:66-3407(+)
MFDGQSKQRYVSAAGKKRDISRAHILHDTRIQRENRAIEKKRAGAAVVIQRYVRRLISRRRSVETIRNKLSGQVNTITKISSMMEFNVPIESVIYLMKACPFCLSPSKSSDRDLSQQVTNIVLKSFQHKVSTFNVLNISSTVDIDYRYMWQIVLSSFCRFVMDILTQHIINGEAVPVVCVDIIDTVAKAYKSGSGISRHVFTGTMLLMGPTLARTFRYALRAEQSAYCCSSLVEAVRMSLWLDVDPSISNVLGLKPLYIEDSWRHFTYQVLSIPNVFSGSTAVSYVEQVMCSSCGKLESSRAWKNALRPLLNTDKAFPLDLKKPSVKLDHSIINVVTNFLQFGMAYDLSLLRSVHISLWGSLVNVALNKSPVATAVSVFLLEIQQDTDRNEGEDEMSEEEEHVDHGRPATSRGTLGVLESLVERYRRWAIRAERCCETDCSVNSLQSLLALLTSPQVLNVCTDVCATWSSDSGTMEIADENITFLGELELLSAMRLLLVNSPAGTRVGLAASEPSVSTSIAKGFAFHRSANLFLRSLFHRVMSFAQTVSNGVKGFTHGELEYSDVAASTLHVLLCTLSHQLMAIDDEEFTANQKTLSINEFSSLISFLKSLLYDMYWAHPLLERSYTDLSMGVADKLSDLQLMLVASKVFNQLAARNERLHFIPPDRWLWGALSASELEVLGEGDPQDVQSSHAFAIRSAKAKTVLQMIPQVISFERRATIFQQLLDLDKAKIRSSVGFFSAIRVEIHRDRLIESAYDTLHMYRSELKRDVKVVFISNQGTQEAGIDGGGLFKEFVDDLMKEMGDPAKGFFRSTNQHLLVPNPTVGTDSGQNLEYYTLLGRMLGKAIYEKILVEPQFAGMFLNQLLGRLNLIDDLPSLDSEVYHSLLKLKRDYLYGDGDLSDLQLKFEASREGISADDRNGIVELIPNGSNIAVTRSNLVSYIYLYAHYKLNVETAKQSRAFLSGFRDLIPVEWIRMFNSQELQRLIGGDGDKPLDLVALQHHCTYSGGYHPSQPYIQEFWKILASLSPRTQGDFLRFVTSCSRMPLLGFGQLNPPFNIMKVPKHTDDEYSTSRLPMASSCFNQFKLPQYDSVEEMREKLLYAIQSKSGFELS